VQVDTPTSACRLAQGAATIGFDLRNRKSHMGQIGQVFEAWVGVVTTGHLCAAFEQMAGHGGASQCMPIVMGPAKVRQCRAERQCGVCDTATDHDLSALVQGVGNGLRAQVGVGTDQGAGQTAGTRLHFRVFAHIVTPHHGDAGRGHLQVLC
jgi:hypothetical protein